MLCFPLCEKNLPNLSYQILWRRDNRSVRSRRLCWSRRFIGELREEVLGMLALYKRDSNAAAAASAISASHSTLVATGAVRATGWVSIVDDGLPLVSHDVALRLASFALDQARARPVGHVERLDLGHRATAGAALASRPP
jgi:hypothetical protein